MKQRRFLLFISISAALVIITGAISLIPIGETPGSAFDGERAYQDVVYQVGLGPRVPGSQAHAATVLFIRESLVEAGWQPVNQEVEMLGHSLVNILATRDGYDPGILIVAHYDSRLVADRDPDPTRRSDPVPGANDGASGVGLLLELARSLPSGMPGVGLLFVDGEDNGNLPGWDWILGSRAFVERLTYQPEAVIVVDMIGDADLTLPIERNSTPALAAEIWGQAESLGYGRIFIAEPRHRITDDHIPFLEAGIPAVDIIDFDYAYWHTTADTADKVSPDSLQIVGDTLLAWLIQRNR
ncbi:MAG: M28 family peptidase [Chloroflexi bacterium]|nr:M28 family peptidase [Chloroflexota bacterium]